MRTTFVAAIALVILQYPAYSIERMKCGGTEPFWDAQLSDSQVIFNARRAKNNVRLATLQGCQRRIHRLCDEC
jgi:uncharacterized membrane protein